MNCINQQQLFDFINKELQPRETQMVEQHINDCPLCKELYHQEIEQINIIKKGIQKIETPQIQIPEFRFPEQSQQVKRKRLAPLILQLSIAASILVLLSISIFIYNQRKQNTIDLQILQFEQEMLITDMNEAWHDREIIFTEIDSKTGKSELFLISDMDQ